MEIDKVTKEFDFYKEGGDYVIDLGQIHYGNNPKIEILTTGIEDSSKLEIRKTCGCTSTDITNVDQHTQSVKITYTQCDPTIAKAMEIRYEDVVIGLIKIRGRCQ